MDFFKSVLSNLHDDDDGGGDVEEEIAANSNPNAISSTGRGAMWNLGGLIKILAVKSETVMQTYRRDLEEFRSGLKKETAALQAAVACVVRDLPGSLEAGAASAQESIESVGCSVVGILAHGREALLRPRESSGPQKTTEISSKQHSRFEAQVLAVQCDQKTFLEEPEDVEDFEIWRTGFELAEKEEEIERLGYENGILKGVIEKLVPDVVDYETFWSRYFYRIHMLKQAEDAQARLIRRVISREEEEEDLSWDADDEEEEKEVKEQKEAETGGEKEDKVVEKGICGGLGSIEEKESIERSQVEQGVQSMVGNVGNAERNGDVWISKLNEKMQEERKVEVEESKLSMPEEDDFEWDELEDLEEHDEKRVAGPNDSLCKVDLHKRLGAAEEDEVLIWDIEDDDDEPTKP
ncbi:BSD domain-containing protein C22A12.14c-like [Phoenix dactylifera]|uniref:BSD domain-containing protein C22A12.14c-like n=1 Tax=Phoenix dactylifera TaxID=42345 RepID=A0A8B7D2U1_PHODC|nr:BSD domain-containing protein C22A12.14c-like [Phoenix dactylifera]